jgi:hypothetical protein
MGLTIRALKESDKYIDSSYSGFNNIRELIFKFVCKELELNKKESNLNNYEGFGGTLKFQDSLPFVELINHSDCDGELDYIDCINLDEDFIQYSKKLIKFIKASNNEKETKEFMLEWIEQLESMVDDVAYERLHSLIFI